MKKEEKRKNKGTETADKPRGIEKKQRERERESYPGTNFNNSKKKCAECGREIDFAKVGIISQRPRGSSSGYLDLHFCSFECVRKYHDIKDQRRENKSDNNSREGKKCADCGATWEGEGCWEYFEIDGKTYCGACCDKKPKKSEVEQERTKLNSLKDKLQNSSDSAEKERLEDKIRETENHIKDLENKDKSKNNPSQSEQPKANYGKLFLAGAVIFSAVILFLALVTRRRKKGY